MAELRPPSLRKLFGDTMIPKDLRLLRDIVALFPGQSEVTWRDRARRGTGPNVYRVSGKYYVSESEAAEWFNGCSLRVQYEVAEMRARHPQALVMNRRARF